VRDNAVCLETLVYEIDWRVSSMAPGRDKIQITPATPLILCVIEETPGLYRVLGGVDPKLEKRVRTAIARLLAEGRKAGIASC
jgi:DNA segregation ATPase FtsK/SpoIIIE-like protein